METIPEWVVCRVLCTFCGCNFKHTHLLLRKKKFFSPFIFIFIFLLLLCHWCRKITIWSTLLKTWTNCACVCVCVLNVSVEYELDCFRLCTCSILHMFNSLIKGEWVKRTVLTIHIHTTYIWVIQSVGSDRGELWIFRTNKQLQISILVSLFNDNVSLLWVYIFNNHQMNKCHMCKNFTCYSIGFCTIQYCFVCVCVVHYKFLKNQLIFVALMYLFTLAKVRFKCMTKYMKVF